MVDNVKQDIVSPNTSVISQDHGHRDLQDLGPTIEVPRDLFNSLVAHLKGVPQDITRILNLVNDIENSPAIQTPTTFPKFPELPPELRLKIWELACSSLRIVGVDFIQEMDTCSRYCEAPDLHFSQHKCTYIMPVTPKVSMLEVSTEARSVALQKSISLVPSKNAIGEQHFPDIRFNLDLDVLWVLNIEGFFGFCDLERMVGKQIKRVAIYEYMWLGWTEEALEIIQTWFPCLEELILVVGAELDFRHQEIELARPARQPWHYKLHGFGPDSVSSKTTWTEIEDNLAYMVGDLIDDRAEHTFNVFRNLGIDPSEGDLVDIDGTVPLWEWIGIKITYREIVSASISVTSVVTV